MNKFRRIAKERGHSLMQVIRLSGVGSSSLYGVLKGERSPTLGWMVTLAEALEVDVVELLKPKQTQQPAKS